MTIQEKQHSSCSWPCEGLGLKKLMVCWECYVKTMFSTPTCQPQSFACCALTFSRLTEASLFIVTMWWQGSLPLSSSCLAKMKIQNLEHSCYWMPTAFLVPLDKQNWKPHSYIDCLYRSWYYLRFQAFSGYIGMFFIDEKSFCIKVKK